MRGSRKLFIFLLVVCRTVTVGELYLSQSLSDPLSYFRKNDPFAAARPQSNQFIETNRILTELAALEQRLGGDVTDAAPEEEVIVEEQSELDVPVARIVPVQESEPVVQEDTFAEERASLLIQIEELQQAVEKKNALLKTFSEKVGEVEEEMAVLRKGQARIAELEQALQAERAQHTKTKASIERIADDKKMLEIKDEQYAQKIIELRNELETARQASQTAKSLQEALTTKTATLTKEKSELSAAAKALQLEKQTLVEKIASLESALRTQEHSVGLLQDRVSSLQEENGHRVEMEKYEAALRQNKQLESVLNELRKQYEADHSALKEERKNTALLQSQLNLKDEERKNLQSALQARVEQVHALETKYNEATAQASKVASLEQEVFQLKNKLALKETENQLLASGKASPSTLAPKQAAISTPPVTRVPVQSSYASSSSQYARVAKPVATPTTEALVVEVIEGKINLRSGPGMEHSPVMQVKEGTRLTVESRVGEWYRVISPVGTRAYVRTDVVREPGAATPAYAEPTYSARRTQTAAPTRKASPSATSEDQEALDALRALKQALGNR